MKKVIVIGGAGYIGSHTCKALQERGYYVVVIDNLSTSKKFHQYADENMQIDILDPKILEINEKHSDAIGVIHFAAKAYVGESFEKPLEYYINNVSGTLAVLSLLSGLDNRSLVFSSSCATYGVPKEQPIVEKTGQEPINPYGRSKHMVEQILQDVSAAEGIGYVALRYFNVAGSDPEGTIGEDHDPETHVIPTLLNVIKNRNPETFTINGTDFDTIDGTCVRDYVHVSDIAEAHVLALEYLLEGNKSDCFNLGTGHGTSVKGLLEACVKLGLVNDLSEIPVTYGPRRPGDPPRLVASPTKAKLALKWHPTYNISDMIEHAWHWMHIKDKR